MYLEFYLNVLYDGKVHFLSEWKMHMKTTISGFQWMAFMIAGSIVAPIAIADLFGLSPVETTGLVQRTMFVLGLSSLLQGLVGHRLPINEGPAGLWWGVFAIYAGLSTTLFSSNMETLRGLEGAMIVSGVAFILLSLFKLIQKVATLFTPVVLGVYLLLLVLQLSGSFINGMLGVGYRQDGVDLPIGLFSLILILFTFYLSRHRITWVSQYSILISLAAGWLIFSLLGFSKPIEFQTNKLIHLPTFFEFGRPIFDSGMITTAIFVTMLLLTNMIASIQVVDDIVSKSEKQEGRKVSYSRAGFVSGINQLLGGSFSAIGPVPISGAAGFIATTNLTSILPFLLGSIFILISSLSPQIMTIFAALPTPVGYAVTFVVFANMIRLSFFQFDQEKDTDRIRLVIGISLMIGVGAMFVPSAAYKDVPPILTSLLNNGLVLGSLTAIIVDQLTRKNRKSK